MESDANPLEIVPIYRDRWEYISDKKSHRVGNIGFLRLLWWNPCRIWSLLTSLSKIWGNIKRSIKTSKQVSQKETAGSCSQWEFFLWWRGVNVNSRKQFCYKLQVKTPSESAGMCGRGDIYIFKKNLINILSIFKKNVNYLQSMSIFDFKKDLVVWYYLSKERWHWQCHLCIKSLRTTSDFYSSTKKVHCSFTINAPHQKKKGVSVEILPSIFSLYLHNSQLGNQQHHHHPERHPRHHHHHHHHFWHHHNPQSHHPPQILVINHFLLFLNLTGLDKSISQWWFRTTSIFRWASLGIKSLKGFIISKGRCKIAPNNLITK